MTTKLPGSTPAVVIVSALGLFTIGMTAGWLPVLIVATAALLLWLGYQFAVGGLRDERTRVTAQRQALDAEWQALEQTRRVRAVFLEARQAMQAEAMAAWPSPDAADREAGR